MAVPVIHCLPYLTALVGLFCLFWLALGYANAAFVLVLLVSIYIIGADESDV